MKTTIQDSFIYYYNHAIFNDQLLAVLSSLYPKPIAKEQIYIYGLTECGNENLLDETKQIHQKMLILNIISVIINYGIFNSD